MKTLHNITTPNKPNITARVRAMLTIVGIITAIVCSLVLLKDADVAVRAEAVVPHPIEIFNVANTGLPGIIKNVAATSTLWLSR